MLRHVGAISPPRHCCHGNFLQSGWLTVGGNGPSTSTCVSVLATAATFTRLAQRLPLATCCVICANSLVFSEKKVKKGIYSVINLWRILPVIHQSPSPWQPDISLVAFQLDGTFKATFQRFVLALGSSGASSPSPSGVWGWSDGEQTWVGVGLVNHSVHSG